ncbi:uncharacterized protein LOC108915646 [Anoplophora glabripennis]|uniref:uncharacterized protein LOC108915646 n=1 Tax=Anoplophora glabripennis TaxID=217634 RepID=UPI00087388EA|nr:uncharacterized protein LOC108915646 [Anoplophora glabripennis]
MFKMNKFITVMSFALLSARTLCEDSCPLDSIKPSLNVTQMIGRWHEYKKTTNFLIDNVCTTYEVTCPNSEISACNVNLLPNGTNTGYTNILTVNGTSTVWGKLTIFFNVDSADQFAILWNCKDDTKDYELAALVRDLSDEDTMKKIDTLLVNSAIKYQYELEIINNTLCSGAKKSTTHVPILLVLLVTIFADTTNT